MGSRLVAITVFVLSLGLGASHASADLDVAVLDLRAVDGEDAVSKDLTQRLRANAKRVDGWKVQDSTVSLEQIMLAHGCSSPKPSCLKGHRRQPASR